MNSSELSASALFDKLNDNDIAALVSFFKLLDLCESREENAMQKLCSVCSQHPADFSINVVVSTVGVSNRLQATSRAMLFCNTCAHDRLLSRALRDAVNKLLTHVEQQLRERSTA